MSDRISEQHRSWNMSRIRDKDTSIEVAVRKALFARGYRYKKNDKSLPGKPDIVLPKHRAIVFVNGCFWHMHSNCVKSRLPKSNVDFWREKLNKNAEKDMLNLVKLKHMGWRVMTVWECSIESDFEETIRHIIEFIESDAKTM